MTESDGNYNLEWKDNSSKPVLKRVNLPSVVHPIFEDIHHDKKLLDIVSDLVSFWVRSGDHDHNLLVQWICCRLISFVSAVFRSLSKFRCWENLSRESYTPC